MKMQEEELLTGKKVLIVDDERDVVESLQEILTMCRTETVADFVSAKDALEKGNYDVVILDIMGVGGYDLLRIATERDIPAIMFTAHALSPEDLVHSLKGGAYAYIPKEEITEIKTYLKEVLGARQKGVDKPLGWFSSLKPFFDKMFGFGWMEKDKEFWEDFKKRVIDTRYL